MFIKFIMLTGIIHLYTVEKYGIIHIGIIDTLHKSVLLLKKGTMYITTEPK